VSTEAAAQTEVVDTGSESSEDFGGNTSESFEDIGDEPFTDEVSFDDDEGEDDDSPVPLYKRQQEKKEVPTEKKILETIHGDKGEEQEEGEEAEDDAPVAKKEEAKEEDKATAEKPKEDKGPKGKKVYVKLGDQTFALDSNATIPHKVDGKTVDVPVQELLNNYSGKVAYDQKFNEINVKNIDLQKKAKAVEEREQKILGQVKEVMDIINNPEANPFEALYKLVDMQNGDRYDFWERSFKTQLEELSNILGKEPLERHAYFLEKKNEYLSQQTEKRRSEEQQTLKLNRYREQADALRKSYGVSETQYVDAYEEIKSWGYEPKDISEEQIVEWAAIKPHKAKLDPMLENYRDQISEESFGELGYKLATYLRTGEATLEDIAKHLDDVFGVPTDVKELNAALTPVGRPKNSTTKTSAPSKKQFEDFSDLDDDY
jgi:hypothetical protein